MKRSSHKSRLIRRIIGIIIGTILAGGLVTIGTAYNNLRIAANNMYSYVVNHANDGRNLGSLLANDNPINISIICIGYHGRADGVMMLTINPHTNVAKLVSVPKDRVLNDGSTITSTYATGGVSAEMQVLHNTYKVPIDTYVTINTVGLRRAVDTVGGIKVKIGKKMVPMNGREAVIYSQGHNKNDYSKTILPVMKGILAKVGAFRIIFDTKFLNELSNDMQSDLTFKELFEFGWNYGSAAKKAKSSIASTQPIRTSRLLNRVLK